MGGSDRMGRRLRAGLPVVLLAAASLVLGAGGPAPQAPSADKPASLKLDRTTAGTLTATDTRQRDGRFVDTYTLEGIAGQRLVIQASSTQLTPSVTISGPSGEVRASTAAGVIRWVLPQNGTYQVAVTSGAAGQTGAYSVRAYLGFPARALAPPTPDSGMVYAVIVGISEYANPANHLDFTALDANTIAGALRTQGVLAPGSVILTDEQATIAAVRAAVTRVAALAGPKDTFLFFYSGHGSQSGDRPGNGEADLRDESIVLYDGQLMSDDEMGQLFSTVHARLAVLALDSCFSGGFARDVVTRPGVLGIFSSEEDVTSAVASEFHAGGYLSHFLDQAFEGEADADHDGVIRSGELQTYLFNAYQRDAATVRSESREGDESYQRLVYDRGGVKLRDPILYVGRSVQPAPAPGPGTGGKRG